MTYFGDGAARQGSSRSFNGYVMEIPVVLSLKITVTQWELL
jgi:hypothetical protein